MTQFTHLSSWKTLAIAGGLSGLLWAPLALGARAYLEDAEYATRPAQRAPFDIEFPRAVLGGVQALPRTAEAMSKYDAISVHAYLFSDTLAAAQRLNPDLGIFKTFLLGGFQGSTLKDPCTNAFGPAFGSTGPATTGCAFYAGHWIYYAGTTLSSAIDASTLSVTVADGTRITPGSYVVIYDAPAGSFRNAEHALVKSVSGGRVTLSSRAFKSTARAHPAGAIMAEHPVAGATDGVENPIHWMYNLSSITPRDANGKQLTDVFVQWLAANYNKDANGRIFSGRVDGILFDTDAWSISWRTRIDVNNDLIPDGGWDASSGTNYWGDGTDGFYRSLRERLPELQIVGGTGNTRGFESLTGTQMEAWPVSNAPNSVSPEYKTLDALLANYGLHLREGPAYLSAYTENLNKSPTRLYPNGVTPLPPSNAPFRFSLGTTLLDDGFYALLPTPLKPDPWYDELAVDVDPKSPNYGRAVASNPQNEALTRLHGGWLGMPLGPRQRVYDDAAFDPSRSLIPNGGLDTSAAITGWRASNIRVSLDTTNKVSGTGSLQVSKHIAYTSQPTGATLRSPTLALKAGVDYTLTFAARALQHRDIKVNVASDTQSFTIPDYWVRRVVNFTPKTSGNYAISFYVGQENVPIWLDDVYVFQGSTNVFTREFESGIVVVNATGKPRTVSLDEPYLRILGTGQDPINNGSRVTSVIVGAYDAAFLVRTAANQVVASPTPPPPPSVDTPTCGKPLYNGATERALFLYYDCGSPQRWHARMTGGGRSSATSYRGGVSANQRFASLVGFSQESSDVLTLSSSGTLISYTQYASRSGEDGFDFSFPAGAKVCYAPDAPADVPVLIGANRLTVAGPISLATFGTCVP